MTSDAIKRFEKIWEEESDGRLKPHCYLLLDFRLVLRERSVRPRKEERGKEKFLGGAHAYPKKPEETKEAIHLISVRAYVYRYGQGRPSARCGLTITVNDHLSARGGPTGFSRGLPPLANEYTSRDNHAMVYQRCTEGTSRLAAPTKPVSAPEPLFHLLSLSFSLPLSLLLRMRSADYPAEKWKKSSSIRKLVRKGKWGRKREMDGIGPLSYPPLSPGFWSTRVCVEGPLRSRNSYRTTHGSESFVLLEDSSFRETDDIYHSFLFLVFFP